MLKDTSACCAARELTLVPSVRQRLSYQLSYSRCLQGSFRLNAWLAVSGEPVKRLTLPGLRPTLGKRAVMSGCNNWALEKLD